MTTNGWSLIDRPNSRVEQPVLPRDQGRQQRRLAGIILQPLWVEHLVDSGPAVLEDDAAVAPVRPLFLLDPENRGQAQGVGGAEAPAIAGGEQAAVAAADDVCPVIDEGADGGPAGTVVGAEGRHGARRRGRPFLGAVVGTGAGRPGQMRLDEIFRGEDAAGGRGRRHGDQQPVDLSAKGPCGVLGGTVHLRGSVFSVLPPSKVRSATLYTSSWRPW